MNDLPTPLFDGSEHQRRKIRLAQLESDAAYFQARLEILGEPRTINQMAQKKTFKLLHRVLAELALRETRKLQENG